MGNQQERSLAWLAGILDGEGTLSVQVYTLPDGRVRLTPFISIVNTDAGILDECRSILAQIGVKFRNCAAPNSGCGFESRLICTNLRVDGQKPVEQLLRVIQPYLRSIKSQRALTILQYLESRTAGLIKREANGQISRSEYTQAEIELISSVRSHKRAKSSETICQAPNVIRSGDDIGRPTVKAVEIAGTRNQLSTIDKSIGVTQ